MWQRYNEQVLSLIMSIYSEDGERATQDALRASILINYNLIFIELSVFNYLRGGNCYTVNGNIMILSGILIHFEVEIVARAQ